MRFVLSVFVMLQIAGCTGCFTPVIEVRQDAGVDGGRSAIDASVDDASSRDSGVADSGSPDAAVMDSGMSDAGPADAGPIDSGFADAGTVDAGPRDAGSREACNGFDDDGNGRIDDDVDGGVLTQACELSLGVCAGQLSYCRDGGFRACDYGSNYQTLEDRCDGIDNDCDGRIDHSWTRVLFSADAGAAGGCTDPSTGRPRVCFVDAFGAQVWVEPEGLLYTNGSRFTRLTRTLAISSDSLDLFAGPARMFRNGNNWLRFVFINGWTGAPPHDHSVALHEVANDGGFKRATDGGAAFIATFFPPASFGIPVTPPLSPSDGGFNTMGILLSETGSNESVAFIAHFDRDGGLSVRTRPLDAGFGTLPISAPYGSGFAVTPGVASTSPVDELSLCDESLTCSTAIAATSSGLSNCTFAGVPNERLVCRGYPSGKPVTWRTLDGGNLFSSDGEVSPLDDKLLGATVSDRLFVLMSFPDGGHQYGTLDSTGAHAFMKSPELVGTWAAVQFHQLDGGLHLVVWGDAQTGLSANSEYDQVNAEFVCVP